MIASFIITPEIFLLTLSSNPIFNFFLNLERVQKCFWVSINISVRCTFLFRHLPLGNQWKKGDQNGLDVKCAEINR